MILGDNAQLSCFIYCMEEPHCHPRSPPSLLLSCAEWEGVCSSQKMAWKAENLVGDSSSVYRKRQGQFISAKINRSSLVVQNVLGLLKRKQMQPPPLRTGNLNSIGGLFCGVKFSFKSSACTQ